MQKNNDFALQFCQFIVVCAFNQQILNVQRLKDAFFFQKINKLFFVIFTNSIKVLRKCNHVNAFHVNNFIRLFTNTLNDVYAILMKKKDLSSDDKHLDNKSM